MIGRIEGFFLKVRRLLSRSEWLVRLLGLSSAKGKPSEAGLVLIQIDGLSRQSFEDALRKNKMPFLCNLLRNEGYQLHTLYSGLPSNTAAFQGEFFYGVKSSTPAFSYKKRETGKTQVMFDHDAAASVERQLAESGEGLLKGGSAYSDIFSGGAVESSFCPATLDWEKSLRGANFLTGIIFVFLNGWSFFRVGLLLIVELILAKIDFIRGLISGRDLWKELKFVPTRVAISILLRELVTMNAILDATRGLPIIHLNYIGYDEQAHRRGPTSAFALWSLKGIDDAIKRIFRSAYRSGRRDYALWVYSDHGQEETIPYPVAEGKTIEEAVMSIIDTNEQMGSDPITKNKGIELRRAHWLGNPISRWLFQEKDYDKGEGCKAALAAMGPVGHVYTGQKFDVETLHRMAQEMIDKAKIPMILISEASKPVQVWTAEGHFELPADAAKVFGADHPFLNVVADDMIALCRHPDSGDFVIVGWRKEGPSLSFPLENGAHAGPGPLETGAFALLPKTAPISIPLEGPLRALHLREGVLRLRDGSSSPFQNRREKRACKEKKLRIMTYNVHSCIGMDGKLSPERIARVISHYEPDIVALQELDVERRRTEGINQANVIADLLKMDVHFHPALQLEKEKYGNAVLSDHPIHLMKAEPLPKLSGRQWLETRGALWVSIEINGINYQLINTHFGLSSQERMLQSEALLGLDWMGHPDFKGPTIVCGDFNAGPKSRVYRRFTQSLQDAQDLMLHHRPKGTWFARYPIHRIDHLFIDDSFEVCAVEIPRTALTRNASDHLPLIVELCPL